MKRLKLHLTDMYGKYGKYGKLSDSYSLVQMPESHQDLYISLLSHAVGFTAKRRFGPSQD
jgi:hypothetical protein